MSNKVAVVFTFKSVEHILSDGGTQSWRMHHSHIGAFDWVICARNRRDPRVEGPEDHGAAFLIGKVRDVIPSTEPGVIAETRQSGKRRYLIRITEAAVISPNIPRFWKWGRWPTHFDDLDALGIDPSKMEFKAIEDLIPRPGGSPEVSVGDRLASTPPVGVWRDVIEAAKVSLGMQLGVEASAIEITVRI